MSTIRESELPGIGHKFRMETRAGDELIVVVHGDGLRELYHARRDDPERCTLVAELDDVEARQIAGIIGGLNLRPRDLDAVEHALDELAVEWHRMRRDSPVIGRTIGELDVRHRTGAAIVAVVGPGQTKNINPGPEQVLEADMTLVLLGERGQIHAVRRLLSGGG